MHHRKYGSKRNFSVSLSTIYVLLFSGDYGVAKNVAFESKMETDLYEFVKCKTFVTSMSLSPDGKFFATWVRKIEIKKVKVERILEGYFDLISSPLSSVKIQIMGGDY